MALYQPSFMLPKNQSIDATDEKDMTFSFKLNGNNPLVAYNIQIYDNDTNKLIYELVSNDNQREIQAKIEEISKWINWQAEKQNKLAKSEDEYESSKIKSNFREKLRDTVNKDRSDKLIDMEKTLNDKEAGKTLSQDRITKYFEYWRDILTDLGTFIGNEENPSINTGEYILNTIEDWLNVDPARKDGIEYEDKNVEIIDRTAFNQVKDIYTSLVQYYSNTKEARTGASDTTYINTTTYTKAKQALYLMYSEFSSDIYFGKDLYESVNSVWNTIDFSKKISEVYDYEVLWRQEISQQEYALAHLSGGYTLQTCNVYSEPSGLSSDIKFVLNENSVVAIVTSNPPAPNDWYYISVNGENGYIRKSDVQTYDIKNEKYYLEIPIYPTNYEGEQNTVYHQLPINVLENGKDYKWSATLYWSTSGNYTEDNKINGSLTSVENFFNTRKKPIVDLANYKEIFTLENNKVEVVKEIQIVVEEQGEERTITIPVGSTVSLLHLDESQTMAYIKYVDDATQKTYNGTCLLEDLSGVGDYDSDGIKNYILPSKKAMFRGYYEQEQYVPISYFRWILYRLQSSTEEVVEIVKDTGLVPSVDFQFFYDGFLNGEKYAIQIFVQTADNVEVQTSLIKFKASYITYEIENMVNAENSPIEHGIIVEWSNLRLINGELEGTGHYENRLPMETKTSLSIDEGSEVVFSKDKGKLLELDWEATQIISTRFDVKRPLEPAVYYMASGIDDNGDVVSKTLEMIPKEDTQETGNVILRYTVRTAKTIDTYEQEIIASPLYWYIIVMEHNKLTVYTKYARGLFPALDQFSSLNKFTGSQALYPEPLVYLDEKSETVEYNYQSIVDRYGNPIQNSGS